MTKHEKMLETPGTFTMAGCSINGNVSVTFQGRSLDGGFWDRMKLCYDILFRPGRARSFSSNTTMITSNIINTSSSEDDDILGELIQDLGMETVAEFDVTKSQTPDDIFRAEDEHDRVQAELTALGQEQAVLRAKIAAHKKKKSSSSDDEPDRILAELTALGQAIDQPLPKANKMEKGTTANREKAQAVIRAKIAAHKKKIGPAPKGQLQGFRIGGDEPVAGGSQLPGSGQTYGG